MTNMEYENMIHQDEVDKDIRNKNNELYTYCSKCNGRVDGKLYWYNGELLCKNCLIEKLLQDKAIYDNWYTNF